MSAHAREEGGKGQSALTGGSAAADASERRPYPGILTW